ncbi:unnamed protein product [Sphagnum tenellum]
METAKVDTGTFGTERPLVRNRCVRRSPRPSISHPFLLRHVGQSQRLTVFQDRFSVGKTNSHTLQNHSRYRRNWTRYPNAHASLIAALKTKRLPITPLLPRKSIRPEMSIVVPNPLLMTRTAFDMLVERPSTLTRSETKRS